MTKAALFDMDGLLIDSEPLWREAEIECFHNVGLSLTDTDCRQTMGYKLSEVVDFWYAKKPWKTLSTKEVEQQITARIIELIKERGKPLPGVFHAISTFQELGFKLAIASSSAYAIIEAVVETLKVAPHFEIIQSAQNLPLGKPHPEVFLRAAKKLNLPAESCLVLEDSFHGVIAAKAAKMPTIAVPDSTQLNDQRFGAADLILPSLESLTRSHIEALFLA